MEARHPSGRCATPPGDDCNVNDLAQSAGIVACLIALYTVRRQAVMPATDLYWNTQVINKLRGVKHASTTP